MKKILLTTALLTLTSPALAADGKAVYGTWLTESGSAHVDIADCGDGTPCGTVTHLTNPDSAGKLDTNNPDPELAKKTIVGSRMLWGFKAKSDKWSSGRIYDAESGKDYKSKIKLLDDGTLEVKGCVSIACKTQIWTAVAAN